MQLQQQDPIKLNHIVPYTDSNIQKNPDILKNIMKKKEDNDKNCLVGSENLKDDYELFNYN